MLKTGPKYIEVMATADSSVVKFHGKEKSEKYILTLMNIVSTVSYSISIGLVKLRLIATLSWSGLKLDLESNFVISLLFNITVCDWRKISRPSENAILELQGIKVQSLKESFTFGQDCPARLVCQ